VDSSASCSLPLGPCEIAPYVRPLWWIGQKVVGRTLVPSHRRSILIPTLVSCLTDWSTLGFFGGLTHARSSCSSPLIRETFQQALLPLFSGQVFFRVLPRIFAALPRGIILYYFDSQFSPTRCADPLTALYACPYVPFFVGRSTNFSVRQAVFQVRFSPHESSRRRAFSPPVSKHGPKLFFSVSLIFNPASRAPHVVPLLFVSDGCFWSLRRNLPLCPRPPPHK